MFKTVKPKPEWRSPKNPKTTHRFVRKAVYREATVMNALFKLRIGPRLAAGFAVVLLISVAVAAVGLWQLVAQKRMTEQIIESDMRKVTMAADWVGAVEINWTRTKAILRSADPMFGDELKIEIDGTSKRITELQKSIEALVHSDEGKAALAQIAKTRDAYRAKRQEFLKKYDAGQDLGPRVNADLGPFAKTYLDAIRAFQKLEVDRLQAAEAQAKRDFQRGAAVLIGGCLMAILLGAGFAWLLARSIAVPLRSAAASAERMATGDLTETIDVQGRDEAADMLRSLSRMQDSLREVVGRVRTGVDSVATAAAQIASGNQDLSGRTEQQASNLQQTAASMDQMTSTVGQAAENARQANQLALSATEVANRGGEAVGQVVAQMNEISASSRKISEIISVIDGIAFQTNILALNAAVEAARAGEQGRGFAVVATEVRTLAQRSAEAAKEIKSLIATSVEKVEVGTQMVDAAGKTMEDLVGQVRRVGDLIGEITAASQEQTAGITQINQAVGQLDQMTQQNAALVEENAAAADSMRQQADGLQQAVGVFRLSAA
jgi:methyl-accepting chemotaxis protein